jgi:hypothetical protein
MLQTGMVIVNQVASYLYHVQLPLAVSIITTAHEIGHNHGSPVSYSMLCARAFCSLSDEANNYSLKAPITVLYCSIYLYVHPTISMDLPNMHAPKIGGFEIIEYSLGH